MGFRRFALGAALLAGALSVGTAAAAAADPVVGAAEFAGEVLFLESGAPGMVMVVVRNGQSTVYGFGETAKGSGRKPDGKSLLRLNSITKVFVSEVAASLAADGKLRLTDPLQMYGGGAKVPASGQRQITLLDLATHSAAMPREMPGAPDGVNPRAWPARADRWKWLPAQALPWAPGSIASYSNVGFDLLTDATETAGGMPYSELLKARITQPLGMPDTTLNPTAEQCARLMTGSGLGGTFPCGDTRATGGSGGLYSTGDDMARWMIHSLADPDGRLGIAHAVYRARQGLDAAIGFDEGASMAGLGMGWVSVAADGIKPMLLTKSGAGLGFMSYVAMAPGRDVAVLVVVNRADFAMFGDITRTVNGLIASLATR
ncbi:D-alanyl-D-alanine-carboxypeptidase/endopeptidase AmpH [Sandaracinobacteroides hominis]|uniref:D-alanyl-D-alanine- carboxypeptidase/endopeptidase AmpH n=1 Tax=Sandaracinobacteroides hominis TaxID=2780086 RepID=UPI0018F79638|nr:D-alanyl-D-alanine-carboxypeptidase/endopeptidase AmpH [Sandaracinobacteroides hominis]